MAEITLITGSTLGTAEYVAEHLAEKLQSAGHHPVIFHGPALCELTPHKIWLVVSSTHGAGDIPDNLQPLYDEIERQKPDLSTVHYGAIGIGNREYDLFCGAIDKIDHLLQQCGARPLGEKLKIDILKHDIPEDPAEAWLTTWLHSLPSSH